MSETSKHQERPERKLATIVSADVAGYSRMVGENEERALATLQGHRQIYESLLALHRGRLFNTAGDALLSEFASAVEAVRFATELQSAIRTRNDTLPAEQRMLFRVGINLGDVIVHGNDLLGDGVNVAARIQTLAEPGGICLSSSVHEQIQNKLSLGFRDLGDRSYKNIARPVRTYSIAQSETGALPTPELPPMAGAKPVIARRGRWIAAAIAAAILLAGGYAWLAEEAHRDEMRRQQIELAAQRRGADEARMRAEQERAAAEIERRAAELEAQRQAAEDARQRAEAAERQAAEEARLRIEEERRRLEVERQRAEAERQRSASEGQRQAATPPGPVAPPAPVTAPSPAAVTPTPRPVATDGVWRGNIACDNQRDPALGFSRPIVMTLNNGQYSGQVTVEGSRTMSMQVNVSGDVIIFHVAGISRSGESFRFETRGQITADRIAARGRGGPRGALDCTFAFGR